MANRLAFFDDATSRIGYSASLVFDYNSIRLGVGTSSPLNLLHLQMTSNAAEVVPLLIDNAGTGNLTAATLKFRLGGTSYGYLKSYYNSGGYLEISKGDGSGASITIDPSGNVGIGTAAPGAIFHVKVSSSGGSAFSSAVTSIIESSGNNYMNMFSGTTSESGIMFGTSAGAFKGAILHNALGNVVRICTSGTARGSFSSTGLEVTGVVTASTDISATGGTITGSTVIGTSRLRCPVGSNGSNLSSNGDLEVSDYSSVPGIGFMVDGTKYYIAYSGVIA
jgi:hypothetical protein